MENCTEFRCIRRLWITKQDSLDEIANIKSSSLLFHHLRDFFLEFIVDFVLCVPAATRRSDNGVLACRLLVQFCSVLYKFQRFWRIWKLLMYSHVLDYCGNHHLGISAILVIFAGYWTTLDLVIVVRGLFVDNYLSRVLACPKLI